MKTINEYINESQEDKVQFFCDKFVQCFKGLSDAFDKGNYTKEALQIMLSNFDMKTLHALSNMFNSKDSKNYMPYEPNADLFSSETNKDKISSQIAEYMIKYIIK